MNSGISAFYVPRSTKDVINNLEDVLLMSSTGNVLHIDREVGVVTNGSPCSLLTHLVTLVKRSQSDIGYISSCVQKQRQHCAVLSAIVGLSCTVLRYHVVISVIDLFERQSRSQ